MVGLSAPHSLQLDSTALGYAFMQGNSGSKFTARCAQYSRRQKALARLKLKRRTAFQYESLEDRRMLSITPPFTPAQIQKAYGLDQIHFLGGNGKGQTIAIIDSGDDPFFFDTGSKGFAGSDLEQFDNLYLNGVDPPSFKVVGANGKSGSRPDFSGTITSISESGTVVTVTMSGATHFFKGETVSLMNVNDTQDHNFDLNNELLTSVSTDTKTFKFNLKSAAPSDLTNSGDWNLINQDLVGGSGEIAQDVEWAHAIAPAAKIVLIEMSGFLESPDIALATKAAATVVKASVVSLSLGGAEFNSETSLDSEFSHTGVSYIVATGDTGEPPGYPDASPNVLAVGATNLALNDDGTYHNEAGWSNITNITGISVNGNLVTITTQNATGLVPMPTLRLWALAIRIITATLPSFRQQTARQSLPLKTITGRWVLLPAGR